MSDFEDARVSQRLDLKIWTKLLPFLKPVWGRIAFVVFMMVLSAAIDASIPLFTSYAVNHFVVPRAVVGLGRFTLVYISVILFQTLTTVLYARHCMVIEMNTGKLLKHACFIHLQKLPLSFYNQTSVGYILARVMSDTNRISAMIAWGSIHMVWNIFYILGILVSMFVLNVRMALTVLCIVPLMLIVTSIFQPKILQANREMRRVNSRITSSFNESINGAKTSKTLVIEEKNCAEFEGITSDMYRASLRSTRLNAVYLPIITLLSSVTVAMVLYRSGAMVIKDTMDFGILSAFIAYAIAVMEPLTQVAGMFSEFMAAQVNIERVFALLEQPVTISDTPEIEEKYGDIFNPKPENYPPIKGDIRFENVWFRYPDAADDDYVLKDINLDIPAGTTVAIVGETGAGKSTLVNLICRFFEPTRGRILIDGVDYRERSLNWLHSNLGYVQQTPHLFSGTIRDNILYGNPGATEEEIQRAVKLVSADTVIEKLEKGIDTEVGEGGDRLSTGEKQLISFARAIIADPPIFILDEATSSIDTETEHLIQNAISHVLKGRTSFIIAHRLSTIRNADLILLIEDQGIVEKGSHEELMALKGRYYRLYKAMMIKEDAQEAGFNLL
ncbi:MAG: ABC transporter ATP-binding protein [Oscillospiraceae bacterium]